VRGGLDDALEKLARRDELRRRAAGEITGTPPAVTELVEAIAAVVGRNPELGVTVGVEGSGDPLLLHFVVDEDGIVQVSADNAVTDRAAEAAPASARHADFDIDDAEPVTPPSGYQFDQPADGRQEPRWVQPPEDPYGGQEPQHAFPPHPFAATPPPDVPPRTGRRRTADQRHAAEEPNPRWAGQRLAEQAGLPAPLPEPIPLRVDMEETELAARRLAALLREDPNLLRDQG
jgi:hypothetical protein